MNVFLTVVGLLALIVLGAFLIHRLNAAHAERIATHGYDHARSGGPRHDTGTMRPPSWPRPSVSPDVTERHDQRDGGRGRYPPRRRRDRTTHHR